MTQSAEPGDTFTKAQVRRGSAWMLTGQIGSNALRFVSNLILTRLVFEGTFGQQALIAGFLQLIELIADIGVWVAIVQSPRGADPVFLNTAWTVQVLRGACLCVVACVAAPVFAHFYGNEELILLIWVASSGMLIGGFASARLLLARRRMAVRQLVVFDLSSQLVATFATVILASIWPSTMALVLGGLAGVVTRVAGSFLFPGPPDRFVWNREALGAISRVGAWTLVNTILSHLAMQDRLVFGKLVSEPELGVYQIAVTIALVPTGVVASMAWSLLLPLASSHVRQGADVSGRVLAARWPLLLVGGWSLSGLCAGGPLITTFLYPESYSGAGFMLQCAAASLWLGVVLEQTRAAIFASMGKLRWTCAGSLVKLSAVVILVPVGHRVAGFEGAIVGFVAAELPRLAATWWISRRSGVGGPGQDIGLSLLFAGASALGWLAMRGLSSQGAHDLLGMAGVFVVVSACWLPVGWPQVKRFLHRG